jgi:hypothetical protein
MISVTNDDPSVENNTHLVKFESEEEKTSFLKKEARFCEKLMEDLLNSKDVNERKKLKYALFKRRMDFLKVDNYTKTSGNIWVKNQVSNDEHFD